MMSTTLGPPGMQRLTVPHIAPRLTYHGNKDVSEAVNRIMTDIINLPVYEYLVLKRELEHYLEDGFDE